MIRFEYVLWSMVCSATRALQSPLPSSYSNQWFNQTAAPPNIVKVRLPNVFLAHFVSSYLEFQILRRFASSKQRPRRRQIGTVGLVSMFSEAREATVTETARPEAWPLLSWTGRSFRPCEMHLNSLQESVLLWVLLVMHSHCALHNTRIVVERMSKSCASSLVQVRGGY